MLFTLDNAVLVKILSAVRGLIQAESKLIPATSFIHFQYKKADGGMDSLVVKASNATVEISQQINDIDIKDVGQGEVLIPARKLHLISDNSGEKMDFSFKCSDNFVEIKSPQNSFKLGTLPPEQFPHMEADTNAGMDFSMRPDDLRYLISQTEYAMATINDPRDYLKGIMMAIEGEHIVTVATDGHRLARCHVKYAGDDIADRRVVLPATAVKEIKNVAKRTEETILMSANEKTVSIQTDGVKILAKVYEEKKYPDYKRVMPSNFTHKVTVDSENFRRALAKMKIVDSTLATIELEKGLLRINSKSEQEHEQVQIDHEAEYTGEGFRIGVNHEYLAQVFNVIESEQATFEFKDAGSAILIHGKDGTGAQHVVMPLRL